MPKAVSDRLPLQRRSNACLIVFIASEPRDRRVGARLPKDGFWPLPFDRRSVESRPLVALTRSRRGFSLRSLWAILAPHFAILARSRSLRENLAAPEPPRPTRRDTTERRISSLGWLNLTRVSEQRDLVVVHRRAAVLLRVVERPVVAPHVVVESGAFPSDRVQRGFVGADGDESGVPHGAVGVRSA